MITLLLSSINVSAGDAESIKFSSDHSIGFGVEVNIESKFLSTHKDYIMVMRYKNTGLTNQLKVKDAELKQYCNAARTDIVTGGIVNILGVPSRSISITNNMPISEKSPIIEKKITGTQIKNGVESISGFIDDGIKQGAYTAQQKVSCLATFNNFITEWNDGNKVLRIDMLNTMNTKIGNILINNDNALSNNIFSFNQNINSCNNLSTFFTNQNAVQSTCLGMSCAAPVGGW